MLRRQEALRYKNVKSIRSDNMPPHRAFVHVSIYECKISV